uniref:Uncharacterized protein n=1 Tax=Plectus sambesii TaxID=2011161 RepID=A0A914WU56_9BILA
MSESSDSVLLLVPRDLPGSISHVFGLSAAYRLRRRGCRLPLTASRVPPTAYGVAGAAYRLRRRGCRPAPLPPGGASVSRRRSPPLGPPPFRTCWDSLPPAVHWSSAAAAACFVLLLLQATLPVPHVSS